MAKQTLLEMTQNILSAMNSDEVNSIGDTVESLQVAEEIRTTFYDIMSNRDLGEFQGLVNLESSGDSDMPHVLKIPDTVSGIKWFRYMDSRNGRMKDVKYLDPEEFVTRVISESLSPSSPYTSVTLLPTSPVTHYIKTNQAPNYFTVLEEGYIVCDAFDEDEESNLTGSNAFAWGFFNPEFELEDDFIPPIDDNLFPLLLAEAKSACFINVKQVANSKEEQRARRQLVRSQTRTTKTPEQRGNVFDAVDYSRKR